MASYTATIKPINTLKRLLAELRKTTANNKPTINYLIGQYRANQTTSEQLCRHRDELNFMAHTYLCYVRSSRLCKEIHEQYQGKGERSVRETADMVGFKLPHDPK